MAALLSHSLSKGGITTSYGRFLIDYHPSLDKMARSQRTKLQNFLACGGGLKIDAQEERKMCCVMHTPSLPADAIICHHTATSIQHIHLLRTQGPTPSSPSYESKSLSSRSNYRTQARNRHQPARWPTRIHQQDKPAPDPSLAPLHSTHRITPNPQQSRLI